MSTLESTISMLEVLPEEDVKTVFIITRDLMSKRSDSPYNKVSKEDVLNDLDISTKQIENGEYSTVEEMAAKLRAKYEL